MDLSTKLKITAVLATVLMAVLWAVPVRLMIVASMLGALRENAPLELARRP